MSTSKVRRISINFSGKQCYKLIDFIFSVKDYYRVAYDEPNYNLLRDQLLSNHARISINNRAQLLDDTFNMALIHQVSYKHAMDLSLYLKTEREYVPWRAVLNEMDYIDIMLYNTPGFTNWKVNEQKMRCIINNRFNRIIFYCF